jgi:Flp pilus assembly protein TadG
MIICDPRMGIIKTMIAAKAILTKYLRNTNGNVAIMLAIGIVPIALAAGVAVDYSRLLNTRTEVQNQLDAAVLAATSILGETHGDEAKALDAARKMYAAARSGKATLLNSSIDFEINASKTGVDSIGGADLDMTFMALAGITTMPVIEPNAASALMATGAGSDVEVALMLDVTGSMCTDGTGPCTTDTKLQGAKAAASQLVDTIVWDDQTVHTSKISLVPFNNVIRLAPDAAGAAIMKSFTNLPATWTGYHQDCVSAVQGAGSGETSGTWSCSNPVVNLFTNMKIVPCVTDRYYEFNGKLDITDAAPGPNKWLNSRDGTRLTLSTDSTDTVPTSGKGATAGDPADNWNYDPDGICYDTAQANEILPLTNDKITLKSHINGLEAKGSTGGPLGTSMAWFTLSPNFSSIWPSSATPQSYSLLTQTNTSGVKALRKIAVLMSDGGYNTYRGWIDPTNIPMITKAAKDTCAGMKAKGIEIFSVGYDLDNLSAAEAASATDVMQSCASDAAHFFNSTDGAALQTAFEQIGSQIATAGIRISK